MSPKLFTALFYLFLFLIICGTLCGHVCANVETPSSDSGRTIELFDEINEAQKPNGKDPKAGKVGVKNYYSPFLVSTNKVVVALAGVNRTSKTGKHITVLTKHIEIEKKDDWGGEVIAKTGSKWQTQFAVFDECKDSDCDGDSDSNVVRGLAAAVKEDKIYIFLANFSTKAQNTGSCDGLNWCFWLAVGDTTQKKAGQPIVWEEKRLKVSGTENFNEINKKDLLDPHLCDSSVFVLEEKKILFIVKNQLKDGLQNKNNEKNLTAFFQYDDGNKDNLELLDVESTAGLHPTFFEWEGKIFKTPTDDLTESSKNMTEFNVNSKKFEKTNNSIARLQSFLKDKKYFVNATIQGKEVLLFTQQNYGASINEVYLWMYDGTRISKVGTMVTNTKENFFGSLLYTKNELFVLHQTYEKDAEQDSKKIYLTRLKEELESIKTILDAWEQNDNNIKKGCNRTNEENGFCSFPLPTNGLVGFLNSTVIEGTITTWKDGYHYTNATVKNGTKSGNGLTFAGAGAGARWPTGKSEGDQPYCFTSPGFTLVATVKIDNDTHEQNSVLGFILEQTDGSNKKSIGLWCSDGKWNVSDGNSQAVTSSITKTCVKDGKYQVALILNDNKFSVYIGKDKVNGLSENILNLKGKERITHFYFGVDSEEQDPRGTTVESHATVTNVLLYNRPFNESEINKLKEYVKQAEDTKIPDEEKGNKGGSTNESEKEAPSPSRTEDGGVGGGVRVFSLLLAVLCVSAPLLHL